MVQTPTRTLLLRAFAAPLPGAERYWREWRASANVDDPDQDAVRMLPLLAPRLERWIENDPARGLMLGICKQAWSRDQVRMSRLGSMVTELRAAGIEPVTMTGGAAWSFIHHPGIRPLEAFELLVRREQLRPAIQALREWRPRRDIPEGEELDRIEGIWLDDGDEVLKLSWRLLPASPEIAADCEKLPRLHPSEIPGATLLPDEEMLLHAVAGYRDDSQIDWRCDALALIAAHRVDWRRMARLVRDTPEAAARLDELREQWAAPIPPISGAKNRIRKVWSDYRWRTWERGRKRSAPGFAAYLCERWWNVLARPR